MERIKQALDRAREGNESPLFSSTVPLGTFPLRPPIEEHSAPPETGIVYTQTRVERPPVAHLAKHRVLHAGSPEEAVGAYKVLRTQVLDRLRSHGWNSVGITSPGIGQGKTLTAINLAISLAAKVDHTVLLVDFDLRRPSVHKYLGITPRYGISDCLFEETPVAEALVNPGIDRLVVLPGKSVIANSSEMLGSPRMSRLVGELLARYPSRIVIFDLPPMLMRDDVQSVQSSVESFLVVVGDGKTKAKELALAAKIFDPSKILGTMLNRSREKIGASY